MPPQVRDQVVFLGMVGDEEKARLLRSVDLYVAPNLGGESFGIILVEAMSAGAPVVASDLDAFRQVLDGGRVGELFGIGDAEALAKAVTGLLGDPEQRARLSAAGSAAVRRYDWSVVAQDILAVYEMVTEGAARVSDDVPAARFGKLSLHRYLGNSLGALGGSNGSPEGR